ncbi:MAG: tyrosine-type recombinase/integrase, partial [Acidimicrobiia bacterium]
MAAQLDPTPTLIGDDVRLLLPSWQLTLRAEGKSPRTIEAYLSAGNQLVAFLTQNGMPMGASAIAREHVEAFLVDLRERTSPGTTATRFRGLQQLFRWLVDEGEIRESPMRNMRPPQTPAPPVDVLTDDQLMDLLGTCMSRSFDDRRDHAILRLFIDTGMRRHELTALTVSDIDLEARVAFVVGKGNRPRACPFGTRTAQALDRYLRTRRAHR